MKKHLLSLTLLLAMTASSHAQLVLNPDEVYRAGGTVSVSSPGTSSYKGGGQFAASNFNVGVTAADNQFRGFALFDLQPFLTEVADATSIEVSLTFAFLNNGASAPDWDIELLNPQDDISNINVEFFALYNNQLNTSIATVDPSTLSGGQVLTYDITSAVQAAGFDATDRYLWIRARATDNSFLGGVNTSGAFSNNLLATTLTIVPEPNTAALVLGAMGVAFLRRRKA